MRANEKVEVVSYRISQSGSAVNSTEIKLPRQGKLWGIMLDLSLFTSAGGAGVGGINVTTSSAADFNATGVGRIASLTLAAADAAQDSGHVWIPLGGMPIPTIIYLHVSTANASFFLTGYVAIGYVI